MPLHSMAGSLLMSDGMAVDRNFEWFLPMIESVSDDSAGGQWKMPMRSSGASHDPRGSCLGLSAKVRGQVSRGRPSMLVTPCC